MLTSSNNYLIVFNCLSLYLQRSKDARALSEVIVKEGARGGLGYVHTRVELSESEQNASVFHPEVHERISEMERLNKESLLNGRGMFDKVFKARAF